MTGNYNDKVRAVVLAALMVLSVFAGTVAFAGSAAAASSVSGGTPNDVGSPGTVANTNPAVSGSFVEGSAAETVTFTTTVSGLAADGTNDEVVVNLSSEFNNKFADAQISSVNVDSSAGSFTAAGSAIDSSDGTAGEDAVSIVLTDGTSSATTATVEVSFDLTLASAINTNIDGDTNFPVSAYVDQSNDGSSSGDVAETSIGSVTVTENDGSVAGAPSVSSAEEYGNTIEVAFNEDQLSDAAAASDTDDIGLDQVSVYVDGEEYTGSSELNFDGGDLNDGRLEVSFDSSVSVSITPSNTVKVKLSNVEDEVGNDLPNTNVSVTETSRTVSETGDGTDISGASNPFDDSDDDGSNTQPYAGEIVAIHADDTNNDINSAVEIQTEAGEYVFDGSTGTNSQVYIFDTSDRNLSAVYEFTTDTGGTPYEIDVGTIRNLGLGITVSDTSIQTDDALEGTVTANAGGQAVNLDVLDSNGDVFAEKQVTLNGSGGISYSFAASTFSDEDAGNYTVEATDVTSGVSVESSTVVVSKAGEGSANFGSNIITDQRGDVVNITVTMTETNYATVTIGSPSAGFRSNVTVQDNNGDGEVLLQFNTWAATNAGPGSLTVSSQNVYSVYNSDDVDDEDSIVSADVDDQNTVSSLLDSGDYEIEATSGQDAGATADNVATLVLEERETTSITSWTAPASDSYRGLSDLQDAVANANVTQDSEIAKGDYAILEVTASGLEGAYETASGNNSEQFFNLEGNQDAGNVEFDLTVNQSNPGSNRDAYGLVLNASNTQVIPNADNDTYYLIYDSDAPLAVRQDNTDYDATVSGSETVATIEDGDTLQANFSVYKDTGNLADSQQTVMTQYELINGDVSADTTPVNVSNAAGQTITGTATVAPGTELTIRIDSDDGVRPSFLKTTSVYVQEDNSWSATFDFSNQNVGDSFNVLSSGASSVIAGSDHLDVDGNVVEATMTTTAAPDTTTAAPDTTTAAPDTTTEAPDTTTAASGTTTTATSTPTSTPGFGVVVALTALIAAALLALRREN